MKANRNDSRERMVAVLNNDILIEIQMADTCIRQATCLPAEYHHLMQRQMALCAAAALANATALAAEILALGGVPVYPRAQSQGASTEEKPVRRRPAGARAALSHYRRRLRMAERLGLLRLREVFQQIVNTKEWHLAHSGLIQPGDQADRCLFG